MKIPTLIIAMACAISSVGQNPETYYTKGMELANEGKFEEAIAQFSKTIELQPENTYAWYNRGIMKSILGWYEDALPDFESAIGTDSTYKPAWLNRGTARKRLTDYQGAMEDYDRVLRMDPTYADAHYQRGTIFELLGQQDSACQSFKKAEKYGLQRATRKVEDCNNPIAHGASYHPILSLTQTSTNKKYGYSKKDPIKVGTGPDGGPANQRVYLMLLRDAKGRPVKFSRSGSCCPYDTPNGLMGGQGMLDVYHIIYLDAEGKEQSTDLYITFYDYDEPKIPLGFQTVKGN